MSKARDNLADRVLMLAGSTHPDDLPRLVAILFQEYEREIRRRFPNATPEMVEAGLRALKDAMAARQAKMFTNHGGSA